MKGIKLLRWSIDDIAEAIKEPTESPGTRGKVATRRTLQQRRLEPSRWSRGVGWQAWTGIAVVVCLLLAFAVYRVTNSSSGSTGYSTLAPASVVSKLASIPASTFNAIDTAKSPDPFTETAR